MRTDRIVPAVGAAVFAGVLFVIGSGLSSEVTQGLHAQDNPVPVQGSGHVTIGTQQMDSIDGVIVGPYASGGGRSAKNNAPPAPSNVTRLHAEWLSGGLLIDVEVVKGLNQSRKDWIKEFKTTVEDLKAAFPPDP